MHLVRNSKSSFRMMLVIWTIFIAVIASAVYQYSVKQEKAYIMINEVCSNNFTLVQDENDKYRDYVELYNPGEESVPLDGYYLSDDENDLQKYSLDSVCIPPKGYYVVWLGEGGDAVAGQRNFGISSSGEEIFLYDFQTEEIADQVAVPELSYNTCYGRITDGGKEWACMSATTGMSNNNVEILPLIQLREPVFSVESGFYEDAFQVTITAPEDEIVFYTLDGTVPTKDSYIYQEPIEIKDASQQENVYAARTDLSPTNQYVPPFKVDKATVVRAISYDPENNTSSKTVTRVYFVGYDKKMEYDNLPIVSIVTDPGNLFDIQYGIYTNGCALEEYKSRGGLQDGELKDSYEDENGDIHYLYMASNAFQDGKEWEREAAFSFFDRTHEYCFTQNVGIQIAGQSTRGTPQKSFSIYGRDIYDENVVFPYEFFQGMSYSSVKLRNGGNNNAGVMFKDAFLEELVSERNVAIQRSEPCVLFLNGEYWGIYNIRERYKEEYIENHYGIDKDNVWMMDGGIARVGEVEAQNEYQYMLDMVTQCDLSYDDVYAMVSELIDVQNLIDYCCINLYFDNRDVSFAQNTALWRCIEPDGSEYGDGRWRWMVFDLDDTLTSSSEDSLSWAEGNDLMREPVIQSLMANEQFRRQFCITFMDIANTSCDYDVVHAKLLAWKELYKVQIINNHQRFFDADYDMETFENEIQAMDNFFKNRFSSVVDSLAKEFDLTGNLEPVTVSVSKGGTVTVNTALLKEDEKWRGEYFTDYPITLTATEDEGYQFVGWSGDVTGQEDQIEVSIPEGGITLRAEFEKID